MNYTLRMMGMIFSAACLTACSTTTPVGLTTPEFGNAVRQNVVAQAVNPNAPEDDSPIEANGQRAANAQFRYEADQVETPAAIATQTSGAAGGGGGGGGGGGN